MAKAVALVAFALGFLAIAGNVQGFSTSDEKKFDVDYDPNKFSVEGNVVCATCKLNSVTDVQLLKKGELEIRCRSRKNGTVTLVQPIVADDDGGWKIFVEDGHQDDLCMVRVVASPDPGCNVKVPGLRGAKITLRNYNHSIYDNIHNRASSDQHGNAVYPGGNAIFVKKYPGFMNNEALPNCRKVRGKKENDLIPVIIWPPPVTRA